MGPPAASRLRRAAYLLAIVGLVSVQPSIAEAQTQACSAGGVFSIFPQQTTPLETGDEFDVIVCIRNLSETEPQNEGVDARLVGTTTVFLACEDSGCATELPGTLEFVPAGGATDCVTDFLDPDVVSCEPNALEPDNQVDIVIGGDGIALPDDAMELTCFATIRVRAVNPVTSPPGNIAGFFFERGETGDDDVEITDSVCEGGDLTGGAGGSAGLQYPVSCEVKVDKQVDCGGGFVDVGFDDDMAETCVGWNEFVSGGQSVPAEAIDVRYVVRNTGDISLLNCEIDESNSGIAGSPIAIGTIEPGDDDVVVLDDDQTCSDPLASGEPNTAMVSCDCEEPFTPEDPPVTDSDTANFECQTPELNVSKAT